MKLLPYEPSPVRVFVVWHPLFAQGEALFEGLYTWLGGARRDLYRRGLGVPVHPWTSPDPERAPALPPGAAGELTVLVPMVDAEMLGRRNWRLWLEELALRVSAPERPDRGAFVVLPWAIHPGSTHVRNIGPLHLLGAGPCDAKQLRRRVTEACASRVRDRGHERGPAGAPSPASEEGPGLPRPLQIFVSYARQDGREIALRVREALQAYGHLSVFLDEHDLHPGSGWRNRLMAALNDGAAMFAIVTDIYASRAWCREELRQFREPHREATNLWSLRPVFILDHLQGAATRSMFEVGNAPAARWSPDRATEVVDELVREVLFAEVNRARAAALATRLTDSVPPRPDVQVVNWVPDTWTLLQVVRRFGAEQTPIAYPGDGLPGAELARLRELFPNVELSSFEDVARNVVRTPPESAPRPAVLLSVSDPAPDELAGMGLHKWHLDDAAVRLARLVLYEGFDVMYGGRAREGFTEGLHDDSGTVVVEARLINHLGWPYSRALNALQIADAFGITRYVRVECGVPADARTDDPWWLAVAASETRRRATGLTRKPADPSEKLVDFDDREIPRRAALVALGGQLRGFKGFVPGVAEEICVAMEAGLPVYVLGAFGGAAGAVAKVMAGGDPSAFSTDAFASGAEYRKLQRAAAVRHQEPELERRLAELLTVLRGPLPYNGLSEDENLELHAEANIGRAVNLVSKGLRNLCAGRGMPT